MAENLAELLKEERAKRGNLSQRELALLVGVSHNTISRAEKGSAPDPDTIRKLAGFFGVPESYLQRLTGNLVEMPAPLTDNQALQIAQRLEELPPGVRGYAIDALSSVLDNIQQVAELAQNSALAQFDAIVEREDIKDNITALIELLLVHNPADADRIISHMLEVYRSRAQEGAERDSAGAPGKVLL